MKSRYGFPTNLKEDEELTHIGPGTPMGELFRRFWQPIAFSDELTDLPKRIRILGEDLVVFRDKKERVGCLELHCSHRQASLEFGKVEKEGLRCHYHGWLYDVEGRVIDMPCEPPGSAQKHDMEHPAYPVMEYGGLVFAYMGPPDKKPILPIYDILDVSKREDVVLKAIDKYGDRRPIIGSRAVSWVRDANWLQVIENLMDQWHVYWLHSKHSKPQLSGALIHRPTIRWEETSIGCKSVSNIELPNGNQVIRSTEIIFPNIILIPPNVVEEEARATVYKRPPEIVWVVPVDDYRVTSYTITTVPLELADKPFDSAYWFPLLGSNVFDRSYEERQRNPNDPEAIESIGPIAVHVRERPVSSDKGVIMYRKMLRGELNRLRKGEEPLGVIRNPEQAMGIPTHAHTQILVGEEAVRQL